ncbi:MAG: FAD-dependent oxidoreductase [Chthoniobacterales bacterium]
MRHEITVLGAGVSGLTCAVLCAEQGRSVTIYAEEIGQATTSAVAAAIWFPYDAEPADAVIAWSLETYQILRKLSADPASGVSMIELRSFARTGELEIPAWAFPLGAAALSSAEVPPSFSSGYRLAVPLTDSTRYLEYLTNRFRQAGGQIHPSRHFKNLGDVLGGSSLLVNCAGAGAQAVVPDPQVEPHRGQVVLVPPLDRSYAMVCDEPPLMYAIPRAADGVFGATNDVSASREPDPIATAGIVAECSRAMQIEPPEILRVRVGLRPFRRGGICLRADRLANGRRVIHNYGHGGSGFTLSWGCARAVAQLA